MSNIAQDIFNLSDRECDYIWHEINGGVYHITIAAGEIMAGLRNWDYNRSIDIVHKEAIKRRLLLQITPLLLGEITILCDMNYRLLVIDGQHRLTAVQDIMDVKPDFNIILQCRVILLADVADIYDTDIALRYKITEIYKICNETRPITIFETIREDIAARLTDALALHPELMSGIVKSAAKRVYRPRIEFKTLKDAIYKQLPVECGDIPVMKFVNMVVKQNMQLRGMSLKEIFGREATTLAKTTITQYDKAQELKFMLHFDCGKYSLDKWIKSIITKLISPS